jgi:hypothetical protein
MDDSIRPPSQIEIRAGKVRIGKVRSGGCACRAVHFIVRGPPIRCGLCHCLTCQKAHASAYFPFVIFARDHVQLAGETAGWDSTRDYRRLFCPHCGSRVASLAGPEIELSLASFDDPEAFAPQYESWVIRRLPWVKPLDVPQFQRNRE